MLGNGRLEAMCFDGEKRLAHIRGKLRKKVWINNGDMYGYIRPRLKRRTKLILDLSTASFYPSATTKMRRETLFLSTVPTRQEV